MNAAPITPYALASGAAPRSWHVMLDLETLSTRKDAAAFQIAALCFDPETGKTGDAFNAFVSADTVHGHVDVGTINWWMSQHASAAVARRWHNEGSRLSDVLSSFAEWLGRHSGVALWSHGATFDIVVLENQYNVEGKVKPWSHRVERDTRTLYALAYADGKPPYVETDDARKHDAAYDCEVQVRQVTLAWAALRGVRAAKAGEQAMIYAVHAAAADTL